MFIKNIALLFITGLVFNCFLINAQESQRNIDSLLNVLETLSSVNPEIKLVEGSDTTKIIVLNRLARHYRITSNYRLGLKYSNESKNLSQRVGYRKGEASALSNIGIINEYKGNYDSALFYQAAALKIRQALGEKRGIASSYHSMGVVYVKQGNYEKAMSFYLKALSTLEELGDKKAVATSYNNIGNIFLKQNKYEKALRNYQSALEIQLAIGDKEGQSLVYGNLGSVYLNMGRYKDALSADFKCLELCKEIDDKEGVAICYNSIGNVYEKQSDYAKALEYQFNSLEIVEETGNKELIAVVFNSIGSLFKKQRNDKDARVYFNKALNIFINIGNKDGIKESYNSLAELSEMNGDYQQALQYHKLYTDIKDTLLNEASGKQITEMNTKYESEKKAKDIQLLTKDTELQHRELERQKLIRNGFVSGLVIALLLAFVIFNRFQVARKQKKIIEYQNAQIVESINYSKKIQDALLPSVDSMAKALPGLFVFYEPKQIVSGDFYFFKEFQNYVLLACVDCTGHGVPGGFMSTLGSLLLDKIANEESLKPSEILSLLNDEIIRILHQQSAGELQDGMDLSVCLIDRHNRNIEFSGARNGIIVVTHNEAKRYKASPLPVGGNYMKKGMPIERNFQTQSISLNSTDWIYMYTDGFIEQVGGAEGIPMNYTEFEDHLVNISKEQNPEEKSKLLQVKLDNWRGSHDRGDDVLIMGFRVG